MTQVSQIKRILHCHGKSQSVIKAEKREDLMMERVNVITSSECGTSLRFSLRLIGVNASRVVFPSPTLRLFFQEPVEDHLVTDTSARCQIATAQTFSVAIFVNRITKVQCNSHTFNECSLTSFASRIRSTIFNVPPHSAED
jgi:hypothetical protein